MVRIDPLAFRVVDTIPIGGIRPGSRSASASVGHYRLASPWHARRNMVIVVQCVQRASAQLFRGRRLAGAVGAGAFSERQCGPCRNLFARRSVHGSATPQVLIASDLPVRYFDINDPRRSSSRRRSGTCSPSAGTRRGSTQSGTRRVTTRVHSEASGALAKCAANAKGIRAASRA